MAIIEVARVETHRFAHRRVQPHVINDCCFGRDFAAWLRQQLAGFLDDEFTSEAPIQEDYGWGFWMRREKASYWVALSFVGEGPSEGPAVWVVSIEHSTGIVSTLLGRRDVQGAWALRHGILNVLKNAKDIRVAPWLVRASRSQPRCHRCRSA